jgi:hypothetical protein
VESMHAHHKGESGENLAGPCRKNYENSDGQDIERRKGNRITNRWEEVCLLREIPVQQSMNIHFKEL